MPAKLVTTHRQGWKGWATVGAHRRKTTRLTASASNERERRSRRRPRRPHTKRMTAIAGTSATSAGMPPFSSSNSAWFTRPPVPASAPSDGLRRDAGHARCPIVPQSRSAGQRRGRGKTTVLSSGRLRPARCARRGDRHRSITRHAPSHVMPDLTPLIAQWGYAAIFFIVVLGNAGLPVPEETVLAVSGYMIWQGRLELVPVILVAVASAVVGDNAAYWIGRRYGRQVLARLVRVGPERLERMQSFVMRYGMLAVFVARFVAGLRFMAGPLAGSAGLSPLRFFAANLLGAAVYVPVAIGAGYAIGYGLGDRIERLRHVAGDAERLVIVGLVVLAVAAWIWATLRARRGG